MNILGDWGLLNKIYIINNIWKGFEYQMAIKHVFYKLWIEKTENEKIGKINIILKIIKK